VKKKFIVPILIFVFLLNGCSKNVAPVVYNNSHCNKPSILGSVEYVKKIQNISKESGNSSAFSEVMIDVDKNGNELVANDQENIIRFRKLVSSLLLKIGHVDIETHYFRNKLNRVPKTLKELVALNKSLPINIRWSLVNVKNSGYHIQGVDGEYNLKFLSYDGFCEAVYNKKGILLDENTDPINMGTYNYSAGMPHNITAHGTFDVTPYIAWGNSINSPQKGKDEINKGVNLALINYKKHAASVYLYRKNLFGMQQGRVPSSN